MPITSLTSYFNTSSFGDQNSYTRNQEELALTLDSAAHELSNWKGLVAMSSGGAGFELGKLTARVLLGSTPALCAVPFLTNAFTFFAGSVADTGLTGFMNHVLGNAGTEENFLDQMTSQGSVRMMGLLGMGQGFAVVQVLQGLASLSRDNFSRGGSRPAPTSFIHHLILGLQCHFGSGMFAGLTGGVLNSVEQRISLRTKNMNVGTRGNILSESFAELGDKLGFNPLLAQGIRGGKRTSPSAESKTMMSTGGAPSLSPPISPARWAEIKRNIFSVTPAESKALSQWYNDLPLELLGSAELMPARAVLNAIAFLHPEMDVYTTPRILEIVDRYALGSGMLKADMSRKNLDSLMNQAAEQGEQGLAAGYAALLIKHNPAKGISREMACHPSAAVRAMTFTCMLRSPSPVLLLECWGCSLSAEGPSGKMMAQQDLNATEPLRRRYALLIVRRMVEAKHSLSFFPPDEAGQLFRVLDRMEESLRDKPGLAFDETMLHFVIDGKRSVRVEASLLEMDQTRFQALAEDSVLMTQTDLEVFDTVLRSGNIRNPQWREIYLLVLGATYLADEEVVVEHAAEVFRHVEESRQKELEAFFNKRSEAQVRKELINGRYALAMAHGIFILYQLMERKGLASVEDLIRERGELFFHPHSAIRFAALIFAYSHDGQVGVLSDLYERGELERLKTDFASGDPHRHEYARRIIRWLDSCAGEVEEAKILADEHLH